VAGSGVEDVHGTDVQLVDALAAHTDVVWVDPPHRWRPGRPFGVMPGRLPDSPGVRRVAISVPPAATRPVVRSVATRSYARSLRRALAGTGVRSGTVVLASWQPVLPLVPAGFRRVLYATDDLVAAGPLWGMDTGYLTRAREANLAAADAVVTVSETLADLLTRDGARPTVMPNGCSPATFDVEAEPSPGIDLPHPVAGIIGQMNERTDLRCLRAVLEHGMSLLVVGPRHYTDRAQAAELASILDHPRAHWVDAVPREDLPAYLAHMDVGLSAYADTPFNRSASPLKTLDYLAAGIPAVVTSVARIETAPPGAVLVADDPAHLARLALEAASAPRDPATLRAEAARHSWTARAGRFLDVFTGRDRASAGC
jgi:glycosyltransferase involved in cell wall biosynthesis